MSNSPTTVSPRPTAALSRPGGLLYLGLLLLCVLTLLVGQHLAARGVPGLRLFGWDGVGLVALGFGGIVLARRAGFTDAFEGRVSTTRRVGQPLLIGLGFGLADVAVFTRFIHPEPVTELMPFMQPFPYAVLLYGAGAVYTEVLYRFLPLPILQFVLGRYLAREAHRERLFGVLALLSSLVEPLQQLLTGSVGLLVYSFGTGFAMNLTQALFFRRYGYLAALLVRVGHYALWHVGFGWWVERSF